MDSSSKDRNATQVNLDSSFESRLELRQLLVLAAETEDSAAGKGRICIDPQAYDDIFKKITLGTGEAQKRLTRERKAAGDQWNLLEGHPQERRRMMIRNDRRLQSWGLYQCLLERYHTLAEHHPREAVEAVELALEVARRLDPAEYGMERIADFQANALAALGDGRRRLSDFEGALEALAQARESLESGTGDPLDEAELEHSWSRLQEDLGDEEEAERALRRARILFRRIGDPRLQPGFPGDPVHGQTAHRQRAGGRRGR
jgi:tetratricopeptide (TPR) repeat protein